jgi:cation diffusion facilitator family transporter
MIGAMPAMRTEQSATPAPRHTAVLVLSLGVAIVLLAVKFWAYALTGSQAIFSDALESIVNVVASAFALAVVAWAGRPADRDHPFGHGKLEFFSAVFEGGLVFAAGLVIVWQAAVAFVDGTSPKSLGAGLALTSVAGVVNGVVGWFLVRWGRRHHSAAIEADGHHLLSDFWTSVGVVAGLALVAATGMWWFDPLVAALMGALLLTTGWRVVRRATGGLLDEEDPDLLRRVVAVLQPRVGNGLIRVHKLRAIRSGTFRHFSAHLVVPEFWSVQRAHDAASTLAAEVMHDLPGEGAVELQTEPCERAWCAMCDYEPCPVRLQPFVRREPLTVDEAVAPDPQMPGEVAPRT